MDGTQHTDGDGVGGDKQRLGPVAGQHLLRQLVAGSAGEVSAIEVALLHHAKPLAIIAKGEFPQIRAIILATDIADALMALGDEEVHYLLADECQIHVNRVKIPLRAAIHEHQLGRQAAQHGQPFFRQMADDQDAIDGRELTPLGTVVAVGQLDVEAGALGLDAVADGEVIGIVDLGALGIGVDSQELQLALVHPFAGAAGLVLQPLGNLEDLLPGLVLDAQAGILVQHTGYGSKRYPRLLCNFLQRSHQYLAGSITCSSGNG